MANIKGITIDIEGNTTGLTNALKGVNGEIRSTSAQLKDVDRLLKLDPHNTELLAQKQRLLGEQINNTKSKIDTLKTAAEQAAERMASGDQEAQEQYEALRREIIQNEQNLKKLEAGADNAGNALEDAGKEGKKGMQEAADAAEDASGKMQRLGTIGKNAAGLFAKGFKAIIDGAADGVKGMLELTVAASDYADTILTASKVTGIGTDNLQAYSYAAELVDVSLDTLTKSMAKNIKSMASAANGSAAYADTYAQIGVAVTDADGKLRDSETVFWETIDALGRIDDETERDALAMQLFGKSAQELNPLIEAGSGRIAELTDEAREMGAVLSKDTLDALGQYNDSIQRIKGGTTALKNTLGTVLLPEFQTVTDGFVEILGNVTTGLQEADGDWGAITDTLADGVAKAFDLVADTASDILGVLSKSAPKILKTVGDLLKNVGKSLAKMAPDVIGILTDMLPDLLATAGEIVGEVGAAVIEKLPEILAGIGEGVLKGTLSIFKSIDDVFRESDDILEESQKRLDEYAGSFNSFADKISDAADGMLNFKDLVSESGRTASEIDNDIQTAEDAIYEILKTAFENQQGLRDEDIENIRAYNDKIRELEKEKIGIYQGVQRGVLAKAEQLAADGLTLDEVAQLSGEAQKALAESEAAIEASYTQGLTHLENQKTLGKLTQEEYDNQAQALKETRATDLAAAKEYYDSVIAIIAAGSDQLAQIDTDAWTAVAEQFGGISDDWLTRKALDYSGFGDQIKTSYADALRGLDLETANAFLSIEAEMINGGGKLDAAAKKNIALILSVFDGLPEGMDETGRSALNALIAGLNFPELSNAAAMSTDEIVTVLKNKFDIVGSTGEELGEKLTEGVDSGAVDIENSGEHFGEGFIKGVRSQNDDAYNAGAALFEAARRGVREAAMEASPSKLMQISGGYFAEGYEVGIKRKTPDVVQTAAEMINLSIAAANVPLGAVAMPDYSAMTGNTSNVTNNNSSMHIAGITVNVNAPNVENVDDLADLVADRINESILGKAAMYA